MPVALDVGGTKISAAVVVGAKVHERRVVATPQPATPDSVVSTVVELVRSVGGATSDVVGVAMTGRIVAGRVTAPNRATLPGWEDYPLQEVLEERLSRSLFVANDAQAAAWGEYRYGAGNRSAGGFAFVTISTGIGAGFVVGGNCLSVRAVGPGTSASP